MSPTTKFPLLLYEIDLLIMRTGPGRPRLRKVALIGDEVEPGPREPDIDRLEFTPRPPTEVPNGGLGFPVHRHGGENYTQIWTVSTRDEASYRSEAEPYRSIIILSTVSTIACVWESISRLT